MKPKDAINGLNPEQWRKNSAEDKLRLLKEVKSTTRKFRPELVEADYRMKGLSQDGLANAHQVGTAMQAIVVPLASNVSACIDVYIQMVDSRMPPPCEVALFLLDQVVAATAKRQ